MYFGLVNQTKRHKVSSYWKGTPPGVEQMNNIITAFGWSHTDVIEAICYCTSYTWKPVKADEEGKLIYGWEEEVLDQKAPSYESFGCPETFTGTALSPEELETLKKGFDPTFFCN